MSVRMVSGPEWGVGVGGGSERGDGDAVGRGVGGDWGPRGCGKVSTERRLQAALSIGARRGCPKEGFVPTGVFPQHVTDAAGPDCEFHAVLLVSCHM